MDYIKEAENHLRHYRDLLRSVEYADRMIARTQWATAPSSQTIAQLSPTAGCGGHKVINTMQQLYELQKWMQQRSDTLKEVEAIDCVLDGICCDKGCELYARVLVAWYVEREPKDRIAEELGYSPFSMHSLYTMKNRALRKFAVSLFGIDALKAM